MKLILTIIATLITIVACGQSDKSKELLNSAKALFNDNQNNIEDNNVRYSKMISLLTDVINTKS